MIIETSMEYALLNDIEVNTKLGAIIKRASFNYLDKSRGKEMTFTFNDIVDVVCLVFDTTRNLMKEKCRERKIVVPRQFVYFFASKFTFLSFSAIALYFNQDHATAIHGKNLISDLISIDSRYMRYYEQILELLKAKEAEKELYDNDSLHLALEEVKKLNPDNLIKFSMIIDKMINELNTEKNENNNSTR